ncbi:pyridoxine 5'-phosphate synthase [Persicirhabdus sediminis]|uniref:Pyridoxine 5'-phosphate synthase n=1 Tax=Persicirhabdus sediminis TaxID=454144 RepID=A0A8J7SJD7_9BACT|nr:pyridoxine 5'-phosphate synthase [Persicirhabdus sediminis]MBK1791279.1 pyridoxine 5'-phosphate synthase [Persicirhabdus sediminis]
MSFLLGVNIDHIATLRQARYALLPDSPNAEPSPLEGAIDSIAGGADSITVHVRGDRRHMQEQDVFAISEQLDIPLNLEMGNTAEMLDIALRLKPEFVCLVPETREEVTTEGGLDVDGLFDSLQPTVAQLRAAGIKVSMFIDPDIAQVEASARIEAEMVELHTGCFANAFGEQRAEEVARLKLAAERGHELGLQVNAGHGINYENIADLAEVPHLKEFNIGHTIVSRSVRVGMTQAVAEMRTAIGKYFA